MKQQDLAVRSRAEPARSTDDSADRDERRKVARFAISATAEAQELPTQTRLSGRASDLGMGGCYVDAVNPFPIGASLVIKLVSGNRNVAAKGTVVYAKAGMGMGVMFTEISADQKENLRAWVGELSGELPGDQIASEAAMPDVEQAAIREPMAAAKQTGLGDALQELVLLLGIKGVLSEDQVERLRKKMDK